MMGLRYSKYTDIVMGEATTSDPVYRFKNIDLVKGSLHYQNSCAFCHGENGKAIVNVSLGKFFRTGGNFSRGFHKIIYRNNGTYMTREVMRYLNGEQAKDVLSYIQANDSIFID